LDSLVDRKIGYGVVQPGDEVSEGVKFIRGGDILNGAISNKLRSVSKEIADGYKRTYLRGGELLVSLVGYPGETAIVPEYLVGANIARQVGLVDIKDLSVAKWLHYYISSPRGKKSLLSNLIGSAQQVINIEQMVKFLVPLPNREEQTAIVAVLQAADKEIQLLKAKAEQLKEQKKGLMQQLLTGKKRLKIKQDK
jgi:type I restriction enzyme S subunit